MHMHSYVISAYIDHKDMDGNNIDAFRETWDCILRNNVFSVAWV